MWAAFCRSRKVPAVGLEPTRAKGPMAFEAISSTNWDTPAQGRFYVGYAFGPIKQSKVATASRRDTAIVHLFIWRHATPTVSHAPQKILLMSSDRLQN
jgi:hypothetical protein